MRDARAVSPPGEPGNADPRVEAVGVSVQKGGRLVVRDVSVRVCAGEVLGVLGPSGAGKSTFFAALAGDERLVRGSVRLLGSDVSSLPLWRRARLGLGYVPQSPSVLWDLTVRGNLVAFLRVAWGRRPAHDEVRGRASRVGLETRLDVRAGSLSGGERRRLEVARALTTSPSVLVCDEPFAGVDPRGAAQLGELLAELAASGMSVVLADHHVEEALRICSRALLLLDGAVAACADPASFRDDPLVRGRYLGTWQPR